MSGRPKRGSSPRSAVKKSPRAAKSPVGYIMGDGGASSDSSSFGDSPSSHRQKLMQTQQQAATQSLMNKSRDMIKKLTEDLSAERSHSQGIQSELDDISNQLAEHRSVSSDMRREIDLLQEKEGHYRNEIENLQVNEENLSAHVNDLDAKLGQKESELSLALEWQEECEILEGTLKEQKQAHDALQQSHTSQTTEHAELLQTYRQQTAELSALQVQLAESQTQAQTKAEALKTAGSECVELRERLEAALGAESQQKATVAQLKIENERLNMLVKYVCVCSFHYMSARSILLNCT
jgi:chromosome segregation ATPase